MKEQIRYKDLSRWLKIAIVGGWISFFYIVMIFLIIFISGALGL